MEDRFDENSGFDLFGAGSDQLHRNSRPAAPTDDDRRFCGDVLDEPRHVAGVDPHVRRAVRRPPVSTAVVADDLVGGGEGILNVTPYLQHSEGAMDEQNGRTIAAHAVGEFASIHRKDPEIVGSAVVGVFASSRCIIIDSHDRSAFAPRKRSGKWWK
jgi:hypothetical protein